MERLNLLTQRLFAEGWTKERHPDYVCDWAYYSEFYGGYEYTYEKQKSMVFTTPCGLLLRGSHWSSGSMSYMGIDWMLENDNPVVNCPYRHTGCECNHPVLRTHSDGGTGVTKIVFCACHETAEPYDYEKSMEKICDERRKWQEERFLAFAKDRRVCRMHCHFDERTNTWSQFYDPLICAELGTCSFCSILGRDLDPQKGNVFYDVKTTRKKETPDLFGNEYAVSVVKGKRLLDHNVSLDICRLILQHCPDCVQRKEESRYSRELFFSEYHGRFFHVETEKLRAVPRAGRDLEQDLADARDGIAVYHAADTVKQAKAEKTERRKKAQQDRLRKAKRSILQNGKAWMDSPDHYRIDRLLRKGLISQEEIEELERRHDEQAAIQQLSLFD